jgi:hypothetical protein
VQDIAAHVLGDHVGRLSAQRDGHKVLNPVYGESFPAFIARINDEWVSAARRISPKLLTDLSAFAGDPARAEGPGPAHERPSAGHCGLGPTQTIPMPALSWMPTPPGVCALATSLPRRQPNTPAPRVINASPPLPSK